MQNAAPSVPAVRDLAPSEAGPLGRLLVRAYSGLEGFPKPAEQPEYYAMLANVESFLGKPATRILVAVAGDGALAGGVVYFGDMTHYGSGGLATRVRMASGIRFLGVDPPLRERGFGKALVKACIELARKQGHRQVILHTTQAMPVARGMYERLGFMRSANLDFSQLGIHVFGLKLNLESDTTCKRQETSCGTT